MNTLSYGIGHWSLEEVIAVAKNPAQAKLSETSKQQIIQSRKNVESIIESGKVVYGINTGFGPLADTLISSDELAQLQYNLLISHAVGVGDFIAKELSKLMMICKVHALARGYSGISLEVVERILFMIEKDCIPCVPEKGSVGASGDLAPLAHLFLPLIGKGKIWQNGKAVDAQEVLHKLGVKALQLKAKEGLALINGTQFIVAHALYGLDKMQRLLKLADICGAMSLEAFMGSSKPFQSELHAIRPFRGTQEVAKHLRELLEGSEINASHESCERVQDPYSIRCMPQVHGASRNAFYHLKELAETELNSVTDNPVVVSESEAISGGNFHGQPLAMALDYGCVAVSELGNISDRRQYLLLEGKYGLPRLLTKSPGLNSGFMIPQYASAALTTENKTLCFPASADSIPTSLGQEDHVSMGSISGRKFNQIIENVEKILAIELMYACQGIDFRRPLQSSPKLEAIHAQVRERVPHLEEDRLIGEEIEKIIDLVRDFEA